MLLFHLHLEVPSIPEILLVVADVERLPSQEVASHLLEVVRGAAHLILLKPISLHFLAELLVELAQGARWRICTLSTEVGSKRHLAVEQPREPIVVRLPLLLRPVFVAIAKAALLSLKPKDYFGAVHLSVEFVALLPQLPKGLVAAHEILLVSAHGRPCPSHVQLLVV